MLYLVQELVQRAIGHEFCDDAEELGLIADAEDLDDVVEPSFVKHLGFFQQTIPFPARELKNYERLLAVMAKLFSQVVRK